MRRINWIALDIHLHVCAACISLAEDCLLQGNHLRWLLPSIEKKARPVIYAFLQPSSSIRSFIFCTQIMISNMYIACFTLKKNPIVHQWAEELTNSLVIFCVQLGVFCWGKRSKAIKYNYTSLFKEALGNTKYIVPHFTVQLWLKHRW